MKLLLIEDEHKLAEALVYLLKKNGYAADSALDGETGLAMAETGLYDLVILDRMLPQRDGMSILRELRRQNLNMPVIFLTAKDTPQDRVEGLDAGADDYLVKPFTTEELLARIRALARRKDKDLVENTLEIAEFSFHPLRGEVVKDNQVIKLTVKESLLLELLMSNHGQIITKEQILAKIWGYNAGVEFGNIDLYIHYLRKKLNTSRIKTVRGVGYCLEEGNCVS